VISDRLPLSLAHGTTGGEREKEAKWLRREEEKNSET